MGFYKIEVKEPLVASFYFESSRVHFLGLSSPIQSGSNCMGKESTVQKVPYYEKQISSWMGALLLRSIEKRFSF